MSFIKSNEIYFDERIVYPWQQFSAVIYWVLCFFFIA